MTWVGNLNTKSPAQDRYVTKCRPFGVFEIDTIPNAVFEKDTIRDGAIGDEAGRLEPRPNESPPVAPTHGGPAAFSCRVLTLKNVTPENIRLR